MRIQLGPWEITETSIRVPPKSKRRRIRSSSAGDGTADMTTDSVTEENNDTQRETLLETLAIKAAFTSTYGSSLSKARRKKVRSAQPQSPMDQFDPSLILTLEHGIHVLGTNGRLSKSQANKRITSSRPQYPLEESSLFNYVSKPVRSSAFVPNGLTTMTTTPTASKKKTISAESLTNLATISACMDHRLDRVYACMDNNRRLVSWPTTATPNDAVSVKLPKPAMSMSLLSSASTIMVYGSCQGGSVYMAKLLVNDKDGTPNWLMEYLEPSAQYKQQLSTSLHLATFAVEVDTLVSSKIITEPLASPGRKRKKSKSKDTTSASRSIVLYQVFWSKSDKNNLLLNKRTVELLPNNQQSSETLFSSAADDKGSSSTLVSIPLLSDTKDARITNVSVVGFVKDDATLVVSFAQSKTGTDHEVSGRHFYAGISLTKGTVCTAPVYCGNGSPCQVGLVGSSIVATLANDGELHFFDRTRGVILHRGSLKDILSSGDDFTNNEATLLSDSSQGKIGIFFEKGGKLCLATSALELDSEMPLKPTRALSLAESLVAAVGTKPISIAYQTIKQKLSSSNEPEADGNIVEQSISKALGLLQSACAEIREQSSLSRKKSFLVTEYDTATHLLVNRKSESSCGHVSDNPQDAVPSKREGKINGVHHSSSKATTKLNGNRSPALVNGLQSPASKLTPIDTKELPLAFLDGVLPILREILSVTRKFKTPAVRKDACLLLRRLVRSDRLSARNHFPPTALEDVLASLERPVDAVASDKIRYSSIDLCFDLFRFSDDVSEQQFAIMLHYLLGQASALDVAHNVLHRKDAPKSAMACARKLIVLSNENPGEDKDIVRLSNKLIVSATISLLEAFATNSDFNESLFRAGAAKVLYRNEVSFLCRLLVENICAGSKQSASAETAKTRARFMKIIAVLSEGLCGSLTPEESQDVSFIRQLVASELKKSESLLPLQQLLEDSVAVIKAADHASSSASSAPHTSISVQKESTRQLPPYQIERLVF